MAIILFYNLEMFGSFKSNIIFLMQKYKTTLWGKILQIDFLKSSNFHRLTTFHQFLALKVRCTKTKKKGSHKKVDDLWESYDW